MHGARNRAPATPQPRLVRVKEACAYAHFSRNTLYRLLKKKKVCAYRHGKPRLTMIDLNSIDSFLQRDLEQSDAKR